MQLWNQTRQGQVSQIRRDSETTCRGKQEADGPANRDLEIFEREEAKRGVLESSVPGYAIAMQTKVMFFFFFGSFVESNECELYSIIFCQNSV